MTVPKKDRLVGWKAIQKAAGWSQSHLRRIGLPYQMEKKGGKTVSVWIYRDNLEVFLKSSTKMKRPITQPVEREHVVLSESLKGLFIFFLLTFSFPILIHRTWFEHEDDHYYRFDYEKDDKERLIGLRIVSRNGQLQKTIYDGDDMVHFPRILNSGSSLYSFSPRTLEHEAVFTQFIYPDAGFVHRQSNRPDPFPLRFKVRARNGDAHSDLQNLIWLEWVDNRFFTGWSAGIYSKGSYPSCIVFLDREFQIMATVYHPGRLRGALIHDRWLFAAGTLNARQVIETGEYRPCFFKINLFSVLALRTSQVLPFSPKTIPSLKRRDYYALEGIPSIAPERYLAGPELPFFSSILNIDLESGNLIWSTYNQGNIYKNQFIFDSNLRLIRAFVNEVSVPAGKSYHPYQAALRYQEWLGDCWSPWVISQ